MSKTTARPMPSVLPPSESELAAWNTLARDEQLACFREALSHPDCDRVSNATMGDILTEARARTAVRRGQI